MVSGQYKASFAGHALGHGPDSYCGGDMLTLAELERGSQTSWAGQTCVA